MAQPRNVRWRYWIPLFVAVLITHLFSTDTFSANETFRIIVPILRFLVPDMSPGGIELLHGVLRKAGHVTEYFIVGLLAYRAFQHGQLFTTRVKTAAILFVVVAAMSDEAQQLLTATRIGSILDVGYDCVGGILGVWWSRANDS